MFLNGSQSTSNFLKFPVIPHNESPSLPHVIKPLLRFKAATDPSLAFGLNIASFTSILS